MTAIDSAASLANAVSCLAANSPSFSILRLGVHFSLETFPNPGTNLPQRAHMGHVGSSWHRFFVPVYYFVSYILTPISTFKTSDMRLIDMAYTTTISPVILSTYYAMYVDSHLSPVLGHRLVVAWLWGVFPVWICITQWVLAKCILPGSTIKRDRLYDIRREPPAI